MNRKSIDSRPKGDYYLDSAQLSQLEQSFREWVERSPRTDTRASRQRILIIFLLIRYTGAKLNEILALNPFEAIDPARRMIRLGGDAKMKSEPREIQISEALSNEIQDILGSFRSASSNRLRVDPGFVRRKFYERARECGLPRQLGGPEMLRQARALELMQGNLPLPAVQAMLGRYTPNLSSSYSSFSRDEIRQLTRMFLEREASRRTSARNAFFGKISTIRHGDILAQVELATMSGHRVTTMITNESLKRLALRKGRLITAEVKAPWIILEKGIEEPATSAENRFNGVIDRIVEGEVSSEYIIRLDDGTALCTIASTAGGKCQDLKKGDRVWALFNCFAVVLHSG